MRDAVIVSAVRTPVGRGVKGTLANTRPDDLAALVLSEAVKRAGVDLNKADTVRAVVDQLHTLVDQLEKELKL